MRLILTTLTSASDQVVRSQPPSTHVVEPTM
jgi:hypothetical protein